MSRASCALCADVRVSRLFTLVLLTRVSCTLSLPQFHNFRSGFWVVAFEQLLDALDRSLQLADQIFIRNGEQIGKEFANLLSDRGIFLATSLHFKQILSIHHIPQGDADSHEQSTK